MSSGHTMPPCTAALQPAGARAAHQSTTTVSPSLGDSPLPSRRSLNCSPDCVMV